jgi:hypothetical protein
MEIYIQSSFLNYGLLNTIQKFSPVDDLSNKYSSKSIYRHENTRFLSKRSPQCGVSCKQITNAQCNKNLHEVARRVLIEAVSSALAAWKTVEQNI